MNNKLKRIGLKKIFALAGALVFFYALAWILLPLLNSSEFQDYIQSLGFMGYVILVFLEFIGRVIAPISGTPGVLIGLTSYGMGVTCLIIYIGSVLGALTNFLIARRYGSKIVKKFVRKSYSSYFVKHLSQRSILYTFLGTVFGFSYLDYSAYLMGLTNMKFKYYAVITSLSAIIPLSIMYTVFKNSDMSNLNSIMKWFAYVSVVSIVFAIWFEHREHKVNESNKKN